MRGVLMKALLLPILVHGRDTANCTQRTQMCNGVMCDDLCNIGTVPTDPWVDGGMAFIRELQRHEPLVRTTMIGTHNSAITQAYGFGIEQDYISTLLPHYPVYTSDNLGEGVCNTFSVLDQLRMGLRHLEIDINSGYFNVPFKGPAELDKIYVCHSPIPLDPVLIVQADSAAKEKGIDLGWNASKLSCIGTNVPYKSMLLEIKGWMDANPEEIVILYLDAKPESVSLKSQCKSAYDDMEAVFGNMIWAVEEGDPRGYSREQMLRMGKRVIFEDHDDGFKADSRDLVFVPALWNHQMGSVAQFPDCTIEGEAFDSWYAPVTYNATSKVKKNLVRGLGWGRKGDVGTRSIANAMDCAVNILSPNYIQPEDIESYVWAVDRAAWRPGLTSGCMGVLPSGKMGIVDTGPTTTDCTARTPIACRKVEDDTQWVVENEKCPAGYVKAVPTTGYALKKLALAANGQTIYVDVAPDGRLL